MKSISYWQNFTNTGKIEDYLSYICHQNHTSINNCHQNHMSINNCYQNDISTSSCCQNHISANYIQQKEELGANPYAGIYQCNRNGIKTDAHRGVR